MRTLVLLFLLLSLRAYATTYYVSNTGSDSSSGTSTTTAWKTIAHVSSQTFQPGDSILFQSGGVWREQLNTAISSQTSTSPITYGRYGSGALPVISGGNTVTSFNPEAFEVPGYFTLSATNDYLTTSATGANLLTGTNFRLAAHAELANYSASHDQILVAMDNPSGASTRHWNFRISYGQLLLQVWDGTNYTAAVTCAVPNPPLVNGAGYWFLVNFEPNNGSGQSSCSIYYSSDGSTYSQAGTTQVGPTVTVNRTLNTPVTVGAYASNSGGAATGVIYSAGAWSDPSGINQVFSLSGSDAAAGSSSFRSAASGETWTMAPGVSILTPKIDTTIYYAAVPPTQPNQLFLNGARLSLASSKSLLGTGDWWQDTTNRRIYIYDNPNAATVEASARQYGIYTSCSGGPPLVLNGLSVIESNGYGIYGCGGHVSLVEDGSSSNNYLSGVRLDGPAAGTEITNYTASYNGQSGVEALAAPSLLVDQTTANFNSQISCNAFHGGIKIDPSSASTNVVVQNSTANYNGIIHGASQPTCITGSGIWADAAGNNFTVRYNSVTGNNERGIDVDADNYAVVYGNVAAGNLIAGIHAYADTSSSLVGTQIYNNTLYGNGVGIFLEGPDSGSSPGGCVNNVIQNNLSSNSTLFDLVAVFGCENPGNDGRGNVYTYNSLGAPTSSFIEWGEGTTYSSYASWEQANGNCGSAGCSHSVQAAAQFVNATAGNYALSPSSPDINAGLTLAGTYQYDLLPSSVWPNGVLTGYQSSYGSGWEIGAYIYVPN